MIVGGGKDAAELLSLLSGERTHLDILGVFDDRARDLEGAHPELVRLGTFDELAAFCRGTSVDLLIVAVPAVAEKRLLGNVSRLMALPVDIRISAHSSARCTPT